MCNIYTQILKKMVCRKECTNLIVRDGSSWSLFTLMHRRTPLGHLHINNEEEGRVTLTCKSKCSYLNLLCEAIKFSRNIFGIEKNAKKKHD